MPPPHEFITRMRAQQGHPLPLSLSQITVSHFGFSVNLWLDLSEKKNP